MAIAPNTTFVSGAVLTAAQMNALPWGIVALGSRTATSFPTTTLSVQVTSNSFTAVANRYYRITYYEPLAGTPLTLGATFTSEIRLTNAAGTRFQNGIFKTSSANEYHQPMNVSIVTTLTAGSTVLVGCAQVSSTTGIAAASATSPAYISVEDIGPA